jgi:exonuclease SbcC
VAEEAASRHQELVKALEGTEDPAEGVETVRKELQALGREVVGLEHEVHALETEGKAIEEEDEELTSLEGEASCPKCRQPLTEEHMENLLEANRRRRRDISSRLREKASGRNRLEGEVEAMERTLGELMNLSEERNRTLMELERAREGAAGMEQLIEAVRSHPATDLEQNLKELEKTRDGEKLARLRKMAGVVQELRDTEGRLVKALKDLPELERRHGTSQEAALEARRPSEEARAQLAKASSDWDETALEAARQEHQEAIKAESAARASMAGIEAMVDKLERDVDQLSGDVERMEGILDRHALYIHTSAWLADRVIPAIRSMEVSVMSLMSEEMDVAASMWFGQLVDDPDLVLSVDEEFVPLVTHQDYEMDLSALSGGERTAAAFAYRLALNGLVRRNATPDQRNLLILDEPTDGFSREQLARMGNVFADLAADQVVIVSHDRELRAFADRVYLVEKKGGSSTVHQVA